MNVKMRHVIVTGGTGVSGVALVRYLLNRGIAVTVLLRENSPRERFLPKDKNLTKILCRMDQYRQAIPYLNGKSYDAFFHLSWDGNRIAGKMDRWNDMYLQNKNITYTLDAVELCHALGCSVFVATGSQAEYGRTEKVATEQTLEKPEIGYGIAKLCAGQMSRIQCKNLGIRHIWARLFSVYGPYDTSDTLISSTIAALQKGESPNYSKGEQIWDYLYSFDAAQALYLLAKKGRDGEIYCVASGKERPLAEYIKIMHHTVNPSIQPNLGVIPYRDLQVMCLAADIRKLQKETEFMPKYTFQQGLEEIMNWKNANRG